MRFADRWEAGRRLGEVLAAREHGVPPVVLGLPRGGVPVALAVARALGAPLDVILVRKLGVPGHGELGMGAIGEGGARVLNTDLVARLGITAEEVARVEARERVELLRRATAYRGDRPPVDLRGRRVLVVDDGVATGSTARVACQVARARGAAEVVLAVPVAPSDWGPGSAPEADQVVVLHAPDDFAAVGQFYRDFRPTEDAEVIACLGPVRAEELEVPVGGVRLPARVGVPHRASSLVLCAPGTGSGRDSPRNQVLAAGLWAAGIATVLVDLQLGGEGFDRDRAVARLRGVVDWARTRPDLAGLPLGVAGASTGAAVAVGCAVAEPAVRAVVCRGGRMDLAEDLLGRLRVPLLMVVGGRDHEVAAICARAQDLSGGPAEVVSVPGAGHLFAEGGTLEVAVRHSVAWFRRYLQP